MPVPSTIISNQVAPLMNDAALTQYNNESCLPYFNIALRELQEVFQENNIPVTNEVSSVLTIPASTIVIAFVGTTPILPAGLVEIQQLWESDDSGNTWTPMIRKEFIPHSLEQPELDSFMIWAWVDNEIRLPPASSILYLKIDYIKNLFTLPTIETIDTDLGANFINLESFLGYRTAGLCARFIGENPTRADQLDGNATDSLARALNIPTKGRQAIMTRRRPFRSSYKMRGWY
jgi:hypothetical protein